MKPFSPRFKLFCLMALGALLLGRLLLHYGPDDNGAGNFTYQTVGTKYGFPIPPGTHVGSANSPRIRLYWHVVSYQKNATGGGGIYTLAFTHSVQDGAKLGESVAEHVNRTSFRREHRE